MHAFGEQAASAPQAEPAAARPSLLADGHRGSVVRLHGLHGRAIRHSVQLAVARCRAPRRFEAAARGVRRGSLAAGRSEGPVRAVHRRSVGLHTSRRAEGLLARLGRRWIPATLLNLHQAPPLLVPRDGRVPHQHLFRQLAPMRAHPPDLMDQQRVDPHQFLKHQLQHALRQLVPRRGGRPRPRSRPLPRRPGARSVICPRVRPCAHRP
mmetsp:Transcript_15484/g.43905  ORF Transcript_15484/g.43905 Transcript_15484/m.43905 type:complete len:209 (+) Transcript_15484:181-807(+)